MTAVTVVDYGAGNLLNVVRGLSHCGAQVNVVRDPAQVAQARRLVVPGVGAFGDCMTALESLGMVQPLKAYVAGGGLFLGICVGMQLLFEASEEFGDHRGLGILPGRVVRIPQHGAAGRTHKIPHIGWGKLLKPGAADGWRGSVLAPLEAQAEASMYFVHSYMAVPAHAPDCLASVDYNGVSICAAVRRGNVSGVQFHPEKSGEAGLSVLREFLALPAR